MFFFFTLLVMVVLSRFTNKPRSILISILRHTDFIESVVMNTPTRAYTHQIYAIVNGVVIKKHYRKTLSSALKTQMRIIGGGD